MLNLLAPSNDDLDLAPDLAEPIRRGLQRRPRRLPAGLLHDAVGSALSEAIAALPEYGATCAEQRLLEAHARILAADLHGPLDVIELGAGTGRLGRTLASAAPWPVRIRYCAVDASDTALRACRESLGGDPSLLVDTVRGDYLDGLEEALGRRRRLARVLVLFLGSHIGTFDRDQAFTFLREAREALFPNDAMLVSVDLQSDVKRLMAAHDDPAGVTAAFNRNALVRLNREFDASFDPAAFDHLVRYDATFRRVELHLAARRRQRVRIGALDLEFELEAGESIWTDSRHTYAAGELAAMAGDAGFEPVQEWIDPEWPYGLNLLRAA